MLLLHLHVVPKEALPDRLCVHYFCLVGNVLEERIEVCIQLGGSGLLEC